MDLAAIARALTPDQMKQLVANYFAKEAIEMLLDEGKRLQRLRFDSMDEMADQLFEQDIIKEDVHLSGGVRRMYDHYKEFPQFDVKSIAVFSEEEFNQVDMAIQARLDEFDKIQHFVNSLGDKSFSAAGEKKMNSVTESLSDAHTALHYGFLEK